MVELLEFIEWRKEHEMAYLDDTYIVLGGD
jgi:hypothetical protein